MIVLSILALSLVKPISKATDNYLLPCCLHNLASPLAPALIASLLCTLFIRERY